jgi:hypothetical protein
MTDYVTNFQIKKRNIPAEVLYLGASNHPGISTPKIVAEIIRRKGELGKDIAPFDVTSLPSGQTNMDNIATQIMVEEIVKELLKNAFVDVAIKPESLAKAAASSFVLPAEGIGIIR